MIRESRGLQSVISREHNPRLYEAAGSPNNDAIWLLAEKLERELNRERDLRKRAEEILAEAMKRIQPER